MFGGVSDALVLGYPLMPLTDAAVRNLRPSERARKVADAQGLYMLVTPTGSRLWRLKFRFEGVEKLLALGSYPAVSLAQARTLRDEAKALLATGVDPSMAKQAAKATAAAAATTFDDVADEFLAKVRTEGRAPSTLERIEWHLSLARPDLGALPVASIRARDVLVPLRKVEARGRHETASRVREVIGRVMRYAVATGRAEFDPVPATRGALVAPNPTPRAAITTAEEFGGVLRAIWGYGGQPEGAALLKLCALLAPRPGELRLSEWSEFDLDAAVWTVPLERMKMRRPHVAPLSRQAVAILRELRSVARPSMLVFPGLRSPARPVSENTLNAALRRLGYAKDEMTGHGFRAAFSTLANESGLWHPDAIERHLAHQEANAVRRAYARGEHWEERVRLAQWWADYCDTLRGGGGAA